MFSKNTLFFIKKNDIYFIFSLRSAIKILSIYILKKIYSRRELNPRPLAHRTKALPNWATWASNILKNSRFIDFLKNLKKKRKKKEKKIILK